MRVFLALFLGVAGTVLASTASAQDLRIKKTPGVAKDYGKILPVGDSITEGRGYTGGWRRMLQEQLTSEGIGYEFVGRRDPYAPMRYPNHEGHSGWKSKEILDGRQGTAEGNLTEWIEAYKPSTIILMIGTNDKVPEPVNQGLILNEIFTRNPTVKVIVGLIPPIKGTTAELAVLEETRNAQRQAAENFRARGFAVEIADTATGFNPSTMLADKVHPNEAGYRFMTRTYRAALKRLWGF